MKLPAGLLLACLLAGCGAVDGVKDLYQRTGEVATDLEEAIGSKPQVSFNWNNGSLTQVTVTFDGIPEGKSTAQVAAAARAAIARRFKQAPGQVVISFVAPGAAGESAEASKPAPADGPSGERLAYVVGCVNCHHQTPKEIMNAPPLTVAKAYSLEEFRTLLGTGKARGGRDLYAQGSIMGIVAREQLKHLTEEEVAAIHGFLQEEWTLERAAVEEAKIATFPPLNLKP
jgi:hypothetical protein